MTSRTTFRTLVALLALGVLALGLSACGDEASADEPPEITYGETVCDHCHMIIMEERYAAGLTKEDGDKLVFDDIGDMVSVVREQQLDPARIWVHDYNSVEWIDGAKATYVASMHVTTPMASGVVAFEDRQAAEAFAAENDGEVMDWATLSEEWEMRMPSH